MQLWTTLDDLQQFIEHVLPLYNTTFRRINHQIVGCVE